MKIPVKSMLNEDGSDSHLYMNDLTRIISNPKMYVPEKNMLLRYAQLLYECGFYLENDSIFDIIDISS